MLETVYYSLLPYQVKKRFTTAEKKEEAVQPITNKLF